MTTLSPPADLALPTYVRASLGNREQSVLDQGFDDSELLLGWWNTELGRAGVTSGPVSVDPNGSGASRLTRASLFRLAGRLSSSSEPEENLNFVWHVLAWGSGRSRRNNRARIASLSAEKNADLLSTALEHARAGRTAEAYACLIRRGGGKIDRLGPAFFTKLLYFAGAGEASHPCLILDARVAASLHAAGWSGLRRTRTRGGGWSYSYNWHTATYVAYCDLLRRWADEESQRLGHEVGGDEIEVALFRGP